MSFGRKWTLHDLSRKTGAAQAQIEKELYAQEPADLPNKTRRKIRYPLLERPTSPSLEAPAEDKARDTAQYVVCVTSFRIRLLDEDNLCEKFHIDALRYAGILPTDAPGRCRIITSQEKVNSRIEERTEITVSLLA